MLCLRFLGGQRIFLPPRHLIWLPGSVEISAKEGQGRGRAGGQRWPLGLGKQPWGPDSSKDPRDNSEPLTQKTYLGPLCQLRQEQGRQTLASSPPTLCGPSSIAFRHLRSGAPGLSGQGQLTET